MHRAPAQKWDLASLAKIAGMSRSSFSARFTELVGEPAMLYLTRWRMDLAHAHLHASTEPLAAVAERFGYQSEAAFCRAFKRTFGVPPRQSASPEEQVALTAPARAAPASGMRT